MEALLPLFVVIPLGFAFITPVLGRFFPIVHRIFIPLLFLFLGLMSGWMLINGKDLTLQYYVGGWQPVQGIPVGIHLSVDGLSLLMLVIINFLAFFSATYSFDYIKQYTSGQYFYALFSLMVAGMNGVVITGDIFNLYVFLEIAAISSYALVAFGTGKEELEASFKYQVIGGLGSLLILFGIGMIYWITGTLNMADIHLLLSNYQASRAPLFAAILFLAGFGVKSAMVPFHAWLPDAHSSAPSPISAMLSGVLIKAIGIYCILRFFFTVFIISPHIAYGITILGTASMIIGVFLAIYQWDIKRLLAYSSISQIGYVVMSAGIGLTLMCNGGDRQIAALAIFGGVYHLINHAVFKGLLFLNAGSLEYRLRSRNLFKMGGLSSAMPVTSATSLVASLAIAGVPPLNGFFSKLVIIIAAIRAGFYGLAVIAVIVSIITLATFMKFQRYAFYGKPVSKNMPDKDVPISMEGTMILLAICCLLLSLLIFPSFRNLILMPAVHALMNMTI